MILVAYPTDINEPRKGLLTVSEKEIERLSVENFVYNRYFWSILRQLLQTQQISEICQPILFLH